MPSFALALLLVPVPTSDSIVDPLRGVSGGLQAFLCTIRETSTNMLRGWGILARWNENGAHLKRGLMLTLESLLEQSLSRVRIPVKSAYPLRYSNETQ